MNDESNYIEVNKKLWNDKVNFHYESDFYNIPSFLEGNSSLTEIEMPFLDNIASKKVLHLQCHFGQDSISLSQLGAKVTGVDFSEVAIKTAQDLASKMQTETKFICADIYDLPNHLNEKFDVVFCSYGTIGWLPDLEKWANVISHFLTPAGKFIFAEFHPFIWMYDSDFKSIDYNYFNTEAIIEETVGTYANRSAPLKNNSVSWNHPISEVVNSLIENGFRIDRFEEFNFSPFNCFDNMVEDEPKRFRIKSLANKIPMVYLIVATKE